MRMDGSPPASARLVFDANTGAFGAPRAGAEPPSLSFIKGPLPLTWIQRAAALPGKALHVALCLWLLKGVVKSATFPLKRKLPSEMGVSPDATYDALTNLENAGLIAVSRHRGR